jgi:hypothetical protein
MNEEKEKNNYWSEERMSERDKDRGRERKKYSKTSFLVQIKFITEDSEQTQTQTQTLIIN